MVEIHSCAWTVSLPELPQKWMPVMGLPFSELPAETTWDWLGYCDWGLLRN